MVKMSSCYRVVGSLGSPYTMKVRAVFRYRRLPHLFEMRNGDVRREVAHVRPQIIPMVQRPHDKQWYVDSTPIIYDLESRHDNNRSVLPASAADRFVAELVEDFADEWLTKAMFHYRWYYAADRDFSAYWIATDHVTGGGEARTERRELARVFCDRQVSRMELVGCTEQNKPVIECTYERVLDALESDVGYGQFLFGTRPSIADFGLFGQLKTLSDDPTPQWLMRQRAPTLCHWIRQLDDLSGLEGAWHGREETPLPSVRTLLELCGQAYLPFLAANEAAIHAEQDRVELRIFQHDYVQPTFRYQLKCYSRLRALYAALDADAKHLLDPVLEATGCLVFLAGARA
jgi:glutathione S-transferase